VPEKYPEIRGILNAVIMLSFPLATVSAECDEQTTSKASSSSSKVSGGNGTAALSAALSGIELTTTCATPCLTCSALNAVRSDSTSVSAIPVRTLGWQSMLAFVHGLGHRAENFGKAYSTSK